MKQHLAFTAVTTKDFCLLLLYVAADITLPYVNNVKRFVLIHFSSSHIRSAPSGGGAIPIAVARGIAPRGYLKLSTLNLPP